MPGCTSSFSTRSQPPTITIRRAMSCSSRSGRASRWSRRRGTTPSVLIVTPANLETIDTLTSGVSGADNDYVFAPARLGPRVIYGLQVRVSKGRPAPVIADAAAFGSCASRRCRWRPSRSRPARPTRAPSAWRPIPQPEWSASMRRSGSRRADGGKRKRCEVPRRHQASGRAGQVGGATRVAQPARESRGGSPLDATSPGGSRSGGP